MRYPVNLDLFADTHHSPSIFALNASMKGSAPGNLRDYCIPVNPYFPTPEIFDSLRSRFQSILKFYPSSNSEIGTRLADFVGLDPDTMVLGNGSTELITWINRLLVTDSLAIPVPTFSRWTDDPGVSGKRVHTFLRRPEKNFRLTPGEFVAGVLDRRSRAAVLCNPNNPTGALMSKGDVLTVLEALRDLDVVVIDESFIDFSTEDEVPSVDREVTRFPNAIVLKSLGKNLGLHGLRMGYAVANAELTARLREAIPFWNMNSVAQALIEELPGARAEYEAGRRRVVRDRIHLEQCLRTVRDLKVFPAQANFVYVRMPEGIEGVSLRNHLLVEHGCLLRECGNKQGSDSRYFRIAARPREEIDFLVQRLQQSFVELGHFGHVDSRLLPASKSSESKQSWSAKARSKGESTKIQPSSTDASTTSLESTSPVAPGLTAPSLRPALRYGPTQQQRRGHRSAMADRRYGPARDQGRGPRIAAVSGLAVLGLVMVAWLGARFGRATAPGVAALHATSQSAPALPPVGPTVDPSPTPATQPPVAVAGSPAAAMPAPAASAPAHALAPSRSAPRAAPALAASPMPPGALPSAETRPAVEPALAKDPGDEIAENAARAGDAQPTESAGGAAGDAVGALLDDASARRLRRAEKRKAAKRRASRQGRSRSHATSLSETARQDQDL